MEYTPLLNDFYQFSMSYTHWKAGKKDKKAVFELFFRKNPFGGSVAVFCGLKFIQEFLQNFKFKNRY